MSSRIHCECGRETSIRPDRLPLAGAAPIVERSLNRVALQAATEDEHPARFCADNDVLLIDGSFDAAGLIRTLEMAAQVLPSCLISHDLDHGAHEHRDVLGGSGEHAHGTSRLNR